MKIIFLGAPGAGKGTQAENACEKLNIPQISTGAILREAIAKKTAAGQKAKEYMDRGELVPDDAVISILKERLSAPDCENGFALDGFPRTAAQAKYLEKSGIAIDLVIDIDVPDERIIERMGGRRVCPGCGASYHLAHKPSPRGESCGKCGAELAIREDDRPEVVLRRLATYHEETEPLKEFYGKKGMLKTVAGQEEVADTTRLAFGIIQNYIDKTAK